MGAETLIKWPGGKAREIKYLEKYIPSYDRYIEPFFGGGAMFFYLRPPKAMINDISSDLMEFYQLVKTQDITFKKFLMAYEELIRITLDFCDNNKETIVSLYMELKENKSAYKKIMSDIVLFVKKLSDVIFSSKCKKIILNRKIFDMTVSNNLYDKMLRTIKNESKIAFDTKDLEENLFTGIMSGVYILTFC